jgi:hypothetical protein
MAPFMSPSGAVWHELDGGSLGNPARAGKNISAAGMQFDEIVLVEAVLTLS